MAVLYITSSESGTGKTMVGAAVLQDMVKSGRQAVYVRACIGMAEEAEKEVALFQKVLGESGKSVVCTADDAAGLCGSLKQIVNEQGGAATVLVEGIGIQDSLPVLEELNAKALLVEGYHGSRTIEKTLAACRTAGDRLLGVIINRVPEKVLASVCNDVSAQLDEDGVCLFGVLGEHRPLYSPAISELVACINGEFLQPGDGKDSLVENVMIGAMTLDSGPLYYGRKENKAVVIRSDRADMQMAALQTSVRCLILCGDSQPLPSVMIEAEKKKVPVVKTGCSVTDAVSRIEDTLASLRFIQPAKLSLLRELAGSKVYLPGIYEGLGLAV